MDGFRFIEHSALVAQVATIKIQYYWNPTYNVYINVPLSLKLKVGYLIKQYELCIVLPYIC